MPSHGGLMVRSRRSRLWIFAALRRSGSERSKSSTRIFFADILNIESSMKPSFILRVPPRLRALCVSLCAFAAPFTVHAADKPNILWISSEDNGPHLGCYGDKYAVTPNLDALAKRSLRYTRASSTAPVCAPARTTIISGIYPPATGGEHMRSETKLPASLQNVPAISQGSRLLLHQQLEGRLQPGKTRRRRRGLGRELEKRTLERPRRRPGLSSRSSTTRFRTSRRSGTPSTTRTGFTIRPRPESRPITRTRPKFEKTGPSSSCNL